MLRGVAFGAPDTDDPHVVDHLVLAVALATMPPPLPAPAAVLHTGFHASPLHLAARDARARWRPRTSAPARTRAADCGPRVLRLRARARRAARVRGGDPRARSSCWPSAARPEGPEPARHRAHRRRDARTQANERFREALAIDPPSIPPARTWRSTSTLAAGSTRPSASSSTCWRAPDDEVAHLHLAEIHYARKRRTGGAAALREGGDRVAADPPWTLHYGALSARGAADGAAGGRGLERCRRRRSGQPVRGRRGARQAPARTRTPRDSSGPRAVTATRTPTPPATTRC